MNETKITVLMPAYNAEKYIKEAIQSVLNQTFPYFELLVINDGSTDRTEEIIKSFADPRIVLISQPNGGVSNALNNGLKNARAEYIARFDADDICCSDRLKRQYDFMEANPGYILAGSDAEYVDMTGQYIFTFQCEAHTDQEIRKLSFSSCPFIHVAVMYKKQFVMEAGGYDENAHTFEDHLLWVNLVKKGKLCNLPEVLVKVRFNPESLTIDEKWRGKRFKKLKYDAIQRGCITRDEGDEILAIIRNQDVSRIKKGAYYSLLAKKYLWNNHDAPQARKNIRFIIRTSPLKMEAYILFAISFLPGKLIRAVYQRRQRVFNRQTPRT